jgi:hypothetical protein
LALRTKELYGGLSSNAQVDHLLHASNCSLLDELPQSIDKPVSAMDSRFSPLVPRLAWYYFNSSITKKESGMWVQQSHLVSIKRNSLNIQPLQSFNDFLGNYFILKLLLLPLHRIMYLSQQVNCLLLIDL